MAFSVPVFPLTVNVYTGPWLTKVFRATTPGNLAVGRRVQNTLEVDADLQNLPGTILPVLLVPPLTDIRSGLIAPTGDILEIPAGSSRWYLACAVEDIGKGFANEHRYVACLQISHLVGGGGYAGCVWPVPMP
jgi:hypothetical protein